jgi:hypothetical protein
MGSKPNSALKIVFGAMTLGEKGLHIQLMKMFCMLIVNFKALIKLAFIP